jgi:hypothetical protein
MATRGRIGIELSDGSILSIYSHWDNYPEYNGRILRTHYNTREKVEELIDSGDCSSIWTDSVWGKPRTDGKKYGPEPYSARGDDSPPRLDANKYEYFADNEEYAYLFVNGEWVCYNCYKYGGSKMPEPVEIPAGALAV